MNQPRAVVRALYSNSVNFLSTFSVTSRFGKQISAGAIGLGLLFVVVASSQAQDAPTNYWWTGSAGDGVWENANNWILTNLTSDGGFYPGVPGANGDGDYATFTNSGTYSVSINSGDTIATSSNIFSCATGVVSTATITLTLNGGTLAPFVSDPQTAIAIGEGSNETTIVYLASSAYPNGVQTGGNLDIGHDGIGKLIVTNGWVQNISGNANIGTGSGVGTLIISGPNTWWEGHQISVGDTNASYGDTLIVSNSASLTLGSTSRVGSGSSQTSSNCLLVVADNGFISVSGGAPVTIGNRSTVTGSAAYNNMAIIANGGLWDNTNHSLVVGADCSPICQILPCSGCAGGVTYATGNVFVVEEGGLGYGFSEICITPSNTFQLYGGTFGGIRNGYFTALASPLGNITNYGVFEGWGTILGSLNTASNNNSTLAPNYGLGFTAVSNQVGALVVSNSFTLATNCVLQIALGTNYYPIVVGLGQTEPQTASSPALTNNLALNGTINFVDSGGFAPGTYTLITYPPSVLGNYTNGTLYYLNTFSCAPTIGTVPNNSYTYTITNNAAAGEINLDVGCPSCAPSITSITRYNSGVDGNNDILLQWKTNGATNNHVQVTTGTANGSYSTNGFANLANIVVTTATTNYLEVGGVTNTTTHTRYYRISSP